MRWIDLKYTRMVGVQLELFKELKNNLWNFRCPVCGDSAKDRTKARGYLYEKDNTFKFKCHNCGETGSLGWFLKYVNPELAKEYRVEIFKETSGGKTRKKAEPKVKPKFKRREARPEQPVIEIPKKLQRFEPVSKLPESHPIKRYVIDRRIPKSRWNDLFWADHMQEVADLVGGYEETKFDSRYLRLLLPFINREGKLTHIQGRAVGEDIPAKQRYKTLEVEEAPKVFGMNRITDDQVVKVVEGPIDSLFLTNCVGMGGADIPWELFDPKNTVFVWDNEPRSPQIIKRMKDAVARGFSVCIWGKTIRKKDINDMVLDGRDPAWLDNYILSHSVRGMKAKMAIAQYKVR